MCFQQGVLEFLAPCYFPAYQHVALVRMAFGFFDVKPSLD